MPTTLGELYIHTNTSTDPPTRKVWICMKIIESGGWTDVTTAYLKDNGTINHPTDVPGRVLTMVNGNPDEPHFSHP